MSLCVYFGIGTLACASWSIPVDHRDLKCSHDLLCLYVRPGRHAHSIARAVQWDAGSYIQDQISFSQFSNDLLYQ